MLGAEFISSATRRMRARVAAATQVRWSTTNETRPSADPGTTREIVDRRHGTAAVDTKSPSANFPPFSRAGVFLNRFD